MTGPQIIVFTLVGVRKSTTTEPETPHSKGRGPIVEYGGQGFTVLCITRIWGGVTFREVQTPGKRSALTLQNIL